MGSDPFLAACRQSTRLTIELQHDPERMDMAGLDLELTEQQALLRDAVQRLTTAVESPTWTDLAQQLGLAGLTLPEAVGGFGGGAAEVALVMAALGPALAGADWLSHVAASQLLHAHAQAAALAAGHLRAALVSEASAATMPQMTAARRIEGTARLVVGAAEAGLFVLALDEQLYLVERSSAGLTIEPGQLHDGSAVADLHFAGVAAAPLTGNVAVVTALVLAGRCAEAVGLMQRMLDDTADYLGQRRQFGAPIASFQALRHRLADMQLAALQAQALTETAVVALDQDQSDAKAALLAACIAVRDAARVVGEGAVQLHGAMGLTEELRLGARFKRLLVIASGLGSEAGLLGRFAAAA